MSLSGVLAYTGSTLADDLQNFEDRILVQIAAYELGIGELCRKCQRLARRYQHVEQICVVTPYRWFPQFRESTSGGCNSDSVQLMSVSGHPHACRTAPTARWPC